MKRYRVLYLINYAPNYRDKFLSELGKHVDLTVTSYVGKEANLKDPEERIGYKYIPLVRKMFFKINFNLKEFTLANGNFDVIIVGYTLWNPFRMINLLRRNKRVICEGMIFGSNNNFVIKLLRKIFVNLGEGILVYSEIVKQRLIHETNKPIIVFNNSSYSKSEITPLPFDSISNQLNILWVGRFQKRKKIERLYNLAKKDKRVNVCLIGDGIKEFFKEYEQLENFLILEASYEKDLFKHFEWCHAIFNPGHVGLLVMNAARFGRPIIIDSYSYHAPEIQLAKDANQDFIDFSDINKVIEYIDHLFENPDILEENAKQLCAKMQNYTIEYMVQQYLKAINGEWN